MTSEIPLFCQTFSERRILTAVSRCPKKGPGERVFLRTFVPTKSVSFSISQARHGPWTESFRIPPAQRMGTEDFRFVTSRSGILLGVDLERLVINVVYRDQN